MWAPNIVSNLSQTAFQPNLPPVGHACGTPKSLLATTPFDSFLAGEIIIVHCDNYSILKVKFSLSKI